MERTKEQNAAYQREWKRKNPEASKAISRRTYLKNREKILAIQSTPEYKARKNELRRARYTPAFGKKQSLWNNYQMVPAELEKMMADQNNRCKTCDLEFTPLPRQMGSCHIDHDHTTGKVRGLLCSGCNTALGMVRDSVPTLQRLIGYLQASIVAT